MTCIKTGAIVHMKSHDLVFAADLFRVGNAIVVRSNGPITRGRNAFAPGEHSVTVTHILASEAIYSEEFWREDLGVFVVRAERIIFAKDYTPNVDEVSFAKGVVLV